MKGKGDELAASARAWACVSVCMHVRLCLCVCTHPEGAKDAPLDLLDLHVVGQGVDDQLHLLRRQLHLWRWSVIIGVVNCVCDESSPPLLGR